MTSIRRVWGRLTYAVCPTKNWDQSLTRGLSWSSLSTVNRAWKHRVCSLIRVSRTWWSRVKCSLLRSIFTSRCFRTLTLRSSKLYSLNLRQTGTRFSLAHSHPKSQWLTRKMLSLGRVLALKELLQRESRVQVAWTSNRRSWKELAWSAPHHPRKSHQAHTQTSSRPSERSLWRWKRSIVAQRLILIVSTINRHGKRCKTRMRLWKAKSLGK